MKQVFTFLTLMALLLSASFAVAGASGAPAPATQAYPQVQTEEAAVSSQMSKREQRRAERLQRRMERKMARVNKRELDLEEELDKTVYIVLSIFSLGWLAMGILDDWEGNNWLIALAITAGGYMIGVLLSFLILPIFLIFSGVVWAFIKMKEYY